MVTCNDDQPQSEVYLPALVIRSDGKILALRPKQPMILSYPLTDPLGDGFRFSQLMLFKPFRRESQLPTVGLELDNAFLRRDNDPNLFGDGSPMTKLETVRLLLYPRSSFNHGDDHDYYN